VNRRKNMELWNTRKRKVLIGAGAILVLVAGMMSLAVSSATADTFARKLAFARIINAEGDTIGAALPTQRQEGVRIYAWASGLTPGRHGIHIHAVGRCDPTAFATAGGHFNPETRQHGLENPVGPHAGDLPNLEVRENGLGILRADSDRISLLDGPKSLFDADGSALIIHAAEDDQMTDPTGNSGARVACGVIQAR